MYFNRKNAAQKNWRMIKKGKHFLFGCSLVFAVGAALVAPSVKADTVAGKGEAETTTTNPDNSKASPDEEVGTYKAPATVATQPVAVKDAVVAEKPTVKVVNKEALTKLVEEVKGLDKTGKTEDSLSRLNTALEQAQKVLANAEASQDQVDAAVASLKEEKATTVAAEENAEATEDKAVPTDETTETSATQPKSRSRRSVGQERDQGRSMEGQDIKFEYKSGKKVENGDPTQRAKIKYIQLDDYEVVNGKTVATDPSGQGRPVLEWTVTFNEAKWDKPGGFWYFSIPKNVSDPYNVITEYDGGTYATRTEWNNGDGNANAEGKQFIDDGSKLESRVKLTTGGNEYDKVPGLNGVMANSKKLYVLQTNIYSGIRKFTVRYRTVVEDPSQTISYIAGVQAAKNLAVNNWYAISGKYDKELVSQVDAPKVTPNLENTSVNVPVKTVASTSSTLSGTGVPGATIKLYIDGQEQNIGNVTVDNDGKWTTGELPTALNNNQGDGTTIKPRQKVEVSQVVNGTESSRRTVPVSLGVTTVEPSSLTTNKDAVVAGQKEVTLKVPHDAGIAYMRYTNTDGQIVEIPVKRDSLSAAWTSEKSDKATVKKVENGKFQDTIFPTMADKIAGTKVEAISNVVEGGFSSVADWQPRSVENQAPTIASAVEGNRKTVTQDAQLDLASLVTVADKEDDKQATLGDKVHAEVVSVNGDTETKTVDTNTPGTYTVRYKAVDSQGLGSNEIEVTVVVNPARQNEAPTVSIQYSDPATKDVYVYANEDFEIPIKFTDDSGKIASANVLRGGNQESPVKDPSNPNILNNEYNTTVEKISTETVATAEKPAIVKIKGNISKDNSGIAANLFPQTADKELKIVTRYATATDTDGAFIENGATEGSYAKDPGSFTIKLKAQTAKYDIKDPETKIPVDDANNISEDVFNQIKDSIKIQYSKTNTDKNLLDKQGTAVDNQTERIESITREGKNVVVTYKDGSKDTKALADFVNVAPKVELPYSNQANKQIYVYTGENTDLTFTGTDEKEIKDLYLRGPGDVSWNNAADYGLPTGKVENGAVTGKGSVSEDKRTATIKMTGKTNLAAGKEWTSFVVSKDNDGKLSNTDYRALDQDPKAKEKPGYVRFVVKNQTSKYDIATPTEKVEVADPANVTKDDLAKIKEKLQIEYAQTNDDANFADKKGKTVDAKDAKTKIESVAKDNAGNLVVTYTDGSTDTKPLSEFVTKAKPTQPKITTDLTGKAGTKTPVEVTAEPGTKVELFDKDGKKIGEGTADNNGKVTITPTVDIPAGNVTAKATKDGQTSDASKPKEATAATPAKPTQPKITTDLTGKAGTKTPVEVTAEPGSTVKLFDKDGNKIGEGTAGPDGKVTITPTVDIPAGNVTAKATKDGQTSDASAPKEATAATAAKPSQPVVTTDLTGKAGTKTPVEVTAEPGTKVELFDKDGNKIGEGTAGTDGKATINPTVDIPAGNVTAKATKDGKTSDESAPKVATAATPAKPSQPVVTTDLTGKAGTKTPVEVTAEPGSTVKLFDKDGNKIGEGTAGTDGKATINPTVDIPAGNVTAKATKDGKTSDESAPKVATAATPAKPSKPVVETDLTGKAGTKTPVEVTAEPGTKVELFDKDGKKIGEGTADNNGKVTITPTVDIPAGNVTAKATKDGQTSDASKPKEATAATPAKPSKPVVTTDLTGKAGTKTPVEVTAEPGSTVKLFDKDGKKIGEGTAGPDGKVTITPTVDIPAGNVTAKATKDGQTSDASAPKEATAATPAKPSQPVVTTDLTGKAGTKTPVEVTAEPGTKVELFDKDGKKIGEGTAGPDGKVTITPTVDIPAGNVTAKATKDGQTSDASKPKEATAATAAKPSQPVVTTDLTGKAGTKTPVEVTAEPGSTVKLFDKDGKKIGEGTAGPDGKVTITPTVDIPAGNVTAKATKDGQTSDASAPKEATAATPAKPSQPVVTTDLTGKAGTKTPVEVTAEPGTKVELFDKDGKKIGEGTADTNGKVTITPTVDIPAGNVTAKATDKAGNVSDPSEAATATTPSTPSTPAKPSKPVVATDLTGKAGTKTPVVVSAEPGTKVELFDKDGKKIGEGTADTNGKVTITPTVDIPAGNVTAKATKDGQTSDASKPKEATAATPAADAGKNKVTDPSVTPVADPSNLTDAEKAKVTDEVKKSNPTVSKVEVGNDGTTTVTYPDGTTAVIPADKTVKKSADKAVKDPTVTPVTNPSNLTDAEKAKVTDEVKKSNPTVSKVEVGNDGTTTVTYPDGTTAVIPADKTVKKSADKAVKDPTVTPVTDPSNLTDAEKAKVADEVKKSNPTVSKVEVGNDGTTTVTYPDGTPAVIPADKTVKKSADKAVKDPTVTPVTDPSNLTDAEKAKVADEVKKSNPTVSKVEVGNGGTTTVTYPDGTTAVIPADKTVKKSADKAVKDPTVTPVTDPSNLTDAEKAKVADEVKKSNPTVSKVEVGNDGTTTVTYPDGTTAVIPADKTVKKSADKVVTDPSVTPVTDPSNLTDAEKTKVAEEVKKANPTVSKVEVGNDGTTTVTYPDGTTAVIPADKTVKKSADKAVKDPTVTPVTDPSNLTDAEKVKVADEVKKSNPTVTDVKVDKDGTTTVTYPDGTPAVIPADKTVKKSVDKGTKDPSVTPVTDPSNLTDAEKAKVADEVKKANPTVSKVEVGNDGTTTVTYPDGTPAVIPADKTVKKSADKAVKDPTVTPVTDPSNLTDAEKAKVADEVKKSNPTVSKVEVGNDGTTTVTYPDGTTAVIPADKTVKKSADKAVKDPSVTPVTDPSNLTDAEKAKVADEVKKSNPTVSKVEVGNDGTTTVTYPDGTTAVIPSDKTVKKSADKAIKDPSVTPVTDPSNLTDAEKAKVADEVKKSNPTVSKVEVGNDGTTTVTYPDGTTAVIPADKTVKKSADKAVKDPSVTPVTDPSNLTDAEKAKVADEVKKSNPTVSKVEVSNDGTTTVTYPDGTTAVIPADKTVKKSADKAVKDPSVTPVTDPSNLTDAEKAKVTDEVKKSNPTVSKVEVGNDGTTTVTYPDGTTAVIPSDKTVKKSSDKTVKDPSVTPVTDPSNLTDAEKAKVADEVKKSNPTVSKVEVGNDGTTTVTYPDGTTAVIPADKTVKKSADKVVTNPTVTPVVDPSNLTDAEKAKVADEVKKANPTAKDIKVNKDGSVVVTFEDGTTAVIPADKTVKKSSDKVKESDGVKNPSVTPVTDPSNLTDAEKAKVADEVKKANPTAKDIKVNNDGSVVVTFEDGSVAVIPAEKAVTAANQDSSAQAPAKKAGAKELPNTGTEQSSASLALALLAAATGGLLFAKKRKEEE